jgi:hypothetical protein
LKGSDFVLVLSLSLSDSALIFIWFFRKKVIRLDFTAAVLMCLKKRSKKLLCWVMSDNSSFVFGGNQRFRNIRIIEWRSGQRTWSSSSSPYFTAIVAT